MSKVSHCLPESKPGQAPPPWTWIFPEQVSARGRGGGAKSPEGPALPEGPAPPPGALPARAAQPEASESTASV